MTVLSKTAKAALDDAANDIIQNLKRRVHYQFDAERLALLYMTREDIEEQRDFLNKYHVEHSYATPLVTTEVTFNHPLVGTVTGDVSLDIHRARTGVPLFWPKGYLCIRPDADEATIKELNDGIAEFVQAKCDVHIYSVVLDWVKEINHVEAMRYLFPPIVRVFRKAGLRSVADRLNEVTKAPTTMPAVPATMRKYIKYANQWAAVQEMLDNFENYYAEWPRTHSQISLSGDIELEAPDADGEMCRVVVCR
jgi:hypothetical protein